MGRWCLVMLSADGFPSQSLEHFLIQIVKADVQKVEKKINLLIMNEVRLIQSMLF